MNKALPNHDAISLILFTIQTLFRVNKKHEIASLAFYTHIDDAWTAGHYVQRKQAMTAY